MDEEIITLTETNDGETVTLGTRSHLYIVLHATPASGYTWEAELTDPAVLEQIGEPEFQADRTTPGSGGLVVFRFESRAEGALALTMEYRRLWEQGVDPLSTFRVNVIVR